MAKKQPPTAPNPYIPSALDRAIEPGLVNPTAQSLNQSPGTPTSPTPTTDNSGFNQSSPIAQELSQAVKDQQNQQTGAATSTASAGAIANGASDYSSYGNPVAGSSGGFAGITTIDGQNIDTMTVYTGNVHFRQPMHLPKDMGIPVYEQDTVGNLLRASVNMPRSDMLKLQNELASAGFMSKKDVSEFASDNFLSGYARLLSEAARSNDPTVTPSFILQKHIQDAQAGAMSSTYTRYNFSDPLAATDIGNKTAESELGHTLSAAQAQQFYTQLHAAQQANPAVTQTTYSVDPTTGYATPSKQVDAQGGFNADSANQLAQNYAQSQPDWATNQASTNLMSTLFRMLGGKV